MLGAALDMIDSRSRLSTIAPEFTAHSAHCITAQLTMTVGCLFYNKACGCKDALMRII